MFVETGINHIVASIRRIPKITGETAVGKGVYEINKLVFFKVCELDAVSE